MVNNYTKIKLFFTKIENNNLKFKGNNKNYDIPKNLTSIKTIQGQFFLLLNTEFRNDTSLSGFILYAATSGSITIQVN